MTDNWKEITDPEELFRLKREGWEIELQSDPGNDKYCPFIKWDGRHWNIGYLFRARTRQPKMKKVKLLAWLGKRNLNMLREDAHDAIGYYEKAKDWIRQPHLDLEVEVPE